MKTLKKNMAALGLNPGTEFLLFFLGIALFVGAGVALMFLQKKLVFLLIPVAGAILYSYFFLGRYSRKLAKQGRKEEEEFVTLFTYFQVYLNDGYNIYNALTSLVPFASPVMRMRLEHLIEDIDADKSITPFVEFANAFADIQIRQVMLSVFQMVDQGTSEAYLQQFRHIFGKLSDQKHELYKQKRIEKVQNLSFLPLVGSGVSMIMLLAALTEIMGGVMNGF